jgi:hypothetical protein
VRRTERFLTGLDGGEVNLAWRAAGVRVGDDFDQRPPPSYAGESSPFPLPEALGAMLPATLDTVRRALEGRGAPIHVLLRSVLGIHNDIVAVFQVRGELRAERLDAHDVGRLRRPVALKHVTWQLMPDLELLRARLITAEELHPLVRAALFPDQPDPGYHPHLPTVDGSDLRIRCRGVWHRVGWRDGHITAFDHDTDELERERTMRSLGGATVPCLRAVDTWLGRTPGKPPRRLRALRALAMLALVHRNTDEVIRILDAGVDLAGLEPFSSRELAGFPDGERLLAAVARRR